MKQIALYPNRPTYRGGDGEQAERRVRFVIDGRSCGHLTLTGPQTLAVATMLRSGAREHAIEFFYSGPSASTAAPTPSGDTNNGNP